MKKRIAYMIFLHGINCLLPLLVIPFLIRTIGINNYGIMGFSIAVNQYLLLLTEYGFTLSAARNVARLKTDINAVSDIFWSVQMLKFVLVLISAIILFVGAYIFKIDNSQRAVVFVGFFIVIGSWITPTWLYLGKEKMNLLMIFTIIPRILLIPGIFYFVKNESNLLTAMYLQMLPGVLTGLISIVYIYQAKWILKRSINWISIKDQLNQGKSLFVSSISTSFYTSSTPLILGIISGTYAVGVYIAADKIRIAIQSLITPISQVIFPKVSALIVDEKIKAYKLLKTILFSLGGVNLILAICVIIFSNEIINLAYSNAAHEAKQVLKVLAPCIFLIAIGSVLGTNIMIPIGMSRQFSKIMFYVGVIHISILTLLVSYFSEIGAACAVLITELLIVLFFIISLAKTDSHLTTNKVPKSVLQCLFSKYSHKQKFVIQ